MAFSEIDNVNVVTYASAIGRWIVIRPDIEKFEFACCNLGDVGHQIVWSALRVFTDQARFVGADGIEVAQPGDAPVGFGVVKIGEDVLDHEFAAAIGIGRGTREVFADRDAGWVAIDGGGGGEDEGLDIGPAHGGEQLRCAVNVVVVILKRLFDGFADGFESGEVHHRGDGVAGKDAFEQRRIANVAFDEARALAAERFQPVDDIGAAVAEIVENEQVMPGLRQRNAGVRADVAGAAGDEDHGAEYITWYVARGA